MKGRCSWDSAASGRWASQIRGGQTARDEEEVTMKRRAIEQWDAGYVRVSTDMQVERDALQNQVQALEAHGAVQGLTLARGSGRAAGSR